MNTTRHPFRNSMAFGVLAITLLAGLVLNPGLPPTLHAETGVDEVRISSAQDVTFVAGLLPRVLAGVDETDIDGRGDSRATVDLPSGVGADRWVTVQEDIRQSEYHVAWQEHTYLDDLETAYQAPNRAQSLRIYFTPQGIRVIPRLFEGDTPPWEWGLSLSGYGHADSVQPVTAATLITSDNRIEYRRGDPAIKSR